MKFKLICLGILSAVSLTLPAQVSYRISGTFENGAGKTLYLSKAIGIDSVAPMDSTMVAADMSFKLEGKLDMMQSLYFYYSKDKRKSIFIDGQPITLDIKAGTSTIGKKTEPMYKVAVHGSNEQQILEGGNDLYLTYCMMQLVKMMAGKKLQDADKLTADSILTMVHMMDSTVNANVKQYMDTTRNNYATVCFFDKYLISNTTFDQVSMYYNNLTDKVKKSDIGIDLKKRIDELGTVSVGGIAPNFELLTPEGTKFSLYQLRGHVVLLDFWASWCGPCLAEMPNVKNIYAKYHDKGLEILGISLDKKKDAWVNAIKNKELNWHHVSSLNQWTCPVSKLFHVTGIPRMYIIDKDGKIIAQDLRGEELMKKMDELFAQ